MFYTAPATPPACAAYLCHLRTNWYTRVRLPITVLCSTTQLTPFCSTTPPAIPTVPVPIPLPPVPLNRFHCRARNRVCARYGTRRLTPARLTPRVPAGPNGIHVGRTFLFAGVPCLPSTCFWNLGGRHLEDVSGGRQRRQTTTTNTRRHAYDRRTRAPLCQLYLLVVVKPACVNKAWGVQQTPRVHFGTVAVFGNSVRSHRWRCGDMQATVM